MPEIELIKYRTINSCLAAYFSCKPIEIDSISGKWIWRDASGIDHRCSNSKAVKDIRRRSFWAWVEDKKYIHYFARKSAKFEDILHGIAHELAHCERPYHRSLKEEQKAAKYAQNAYDAYFMAKSIEQDRWGAQH